MTGTVTKGLAMRGDLDNFDGTLSTSRDNSSGGTTTGLKVGDGVDVLSVFGDGDTSNQTLETMLKATVALGSQNVSLVFAPGTWAVTDDITIASNFTVVAPAGCVFSVSSGKTLTSGGVFDRQHDTYSSGSGTVTISGTDLMAGINHGEGYAADSGAADAYVIAPSPSISSYVAGQRFQFKAGNANTGVATLNVNSVGTKTIKKDISTDLEANDIAQDDIVTVTYDGTNFQAIPTFGMIENAQAGIIPSGSLMLFQQSAAPTGWTKQTTHNNKALRVVSGTASSGGSDSFTTVFGSSKSTASHTLLLAEIPAHTHTTGSAFTGSGASGSGAGSSTFTTVTGSAGGGGGHSHDTTMDIEYVDLIICSKD